MNGEGRLEKNSSLFVILYRKEKINEEERKAMEIRALRCQCAVLEGRRIKKRKENKVN